MEFCDGLSSIPPRYSFCIGRDVMDAARATVRTPGVVGVHFRGPVSNLGFKREAATTVVCTASIAPVPSAATAAAREVVAVIGVRDAVSLAFHVPLLN